MGDLVRRNSLWYLKFSDVPFTGEVTGQEQGSIKNGDREGLWVWYHMNGQLKTKGNFKNGDLDGVWEWYFGDGRLLNKENYKNGVQISD